MPGRHTPALAKKLNADRWPLTASTLTCWQQTQFDKVALSIRLSAISFTPGGTRQRSQKG
jgi:hypothetical protein